MLVFGPANVLPNDTDFKVFNLTSMCESIPRMEPLLVNVPQNLWADSEFEKSFDIWYHDYLVKNDDAFLSYMQIIVSLYSGEKVYVCISRLESDPYLDTINESFMKFVQQRYTLKYHIVNTREDLDDLQDGGSDFALFEGLEVLDVDKMRYIKTLSLRGTNFYGF